MTSAGRGMETSWCLGLSTTLLLCGTSTKVRLDLQISMCIPLIFSFICYVREVFLNM